ncbi:unnamed protein product [Ranitomeya imitator]|uniref:Potassium-transporting ATPase subunit beta n=1 Tax=Ranitomeya imitator TaxID=111125 RepID=A0ABN9M322_9NEOB|nr:unnamed protein product [Ranitomeya imitator]
MLRSGKTSRISVSAVYNKTNQVDMKNKDCSNATNVKSILTVNENTKRACQFTTDMLGDCSHDKDPTFGFASGQPCLFIKINRIKENLDMIGAYELAMT